MANLQKTQSSRAKMARAQAAPPDGGDAGPSTEAIAARAYELWQANGCPQGRDSEFWYQAERELQARSAR